MGYILKMPKIISILGSTGSIGQNAIKIIDDCKEMFEVNVLTARNNVELLASQAKKVNAKTVVIADVSLYHPLKDKLKDTKIEVYAGEDEIINAAKLKNDMVLSSIVGIAGLMPTIAAIEAGADIALANKECLVCAGNFMMDRARDKKVNIIPVDSEHSAIFQVLDRDNLDKIEKIVLTASGGPFRSFTKGQILNITLEQALNHPNWNMGAKITIDSATMVNKALEFIEAHYLFSLSYDKIEIVIHPESIIHSMVEYIDGSTLAQLGMPDMSTPISYALNWPERVKLDRTKLDLTRISQLNFEKPDEEKFPALKLVKNVLKAGGAYPTIMNGANEVAVNAFLTKEIKFIDIMKIVENTLNDLSFSSPKNIDEIIYIDKQTRNAANKILKGLNSKSAA